MPEPRFAAETKVPTAKSRAEIEQVLIRYGATGVMAGWEPDRAVVAFVVRGRQIRFAIPLPQAGERQFTHTPNGKPRTQLQADLHYQQALRASWRSLLLIIKAKLEAVAAGVTEFEVEFFAYTVLPSGSTVFETAGPQVAAAIETGQVPKLLPRAITGGTDA